jgi:hypothetical protein
MAKGPGHPDSAAGIYLRSPGEVYHPKITQNERQERFNQSVPLGLQPGRASVNRMEQTGAIPQEAKAWINLQDKQT